MAATTTDVSQVFTLGTGDYNGGSLLATQAYVLAAAIWPAEAVSVSQLYKLAAAASSNTITNSQTYVLAACLGRTEDPRVRAWTYTLDGHDFYVLRLGSEETIVFDVSTGQWSTFGSGYGPLWRAFNGQNWLGADGLAGTYGSNIIVGDDGNGSLYFLDPDEDFDDDPLLGSEVQREFERVAIGQVLAKGYDAQRCFGATVLGSIGTQAEEDIPSRTVTLSMSDDVGRSYTDLGNITIPYDEYYTRLNWRSLGSIRYPGRLFKVVDIGALRRIDGLEVEDGS